jgi:tripartite-type tricarboxylate transporter receptor subunit TctC
MPGVPILNEAGLNVSSIVGYGLSAPASTPETVLTKLKQGISNMMKDKALLARLSEMGYETDLQLGDAYRDFILKDLEQWRSVAKAANVRIDK